MKFEKDDIILTRKLSPGKVNSKMYYSLRYLDLNRNQDKIIEKTEISHIFEKLSLYREFGVTILSDKKTFDDLFNLIDSNNDPKVELLLQKVKETLELVVQEHKLYPVEKISKKNHIKMHKPSSAKSWNEIKNKIMKLREKIN